MSRSILFKWLRICGGFLLLAVGIFLSIPAVPGPGFAVILAALVILSPHFAWARKILEWAKAKYRKLTSR